MNFVLHSAVQIYKHHIVYIDFSTFCSVSFQTQKQSPRTTFVKYIDLICSNLHLGPGATADCGKKEVYILHGRPNKISNKASDSDSYLKQIFKLIVSTSGNTLKI